MFKLEQGLYIELNAPGLWPNCVESPAVPVIFGLEKRPTAEFNLRCESTSGMNLGVLRGGGQACENRQELCLAKAVYEFASYLRTGPRVCTLD